MYANLAETIYFLISNFKIIFLMNKNDATIISIYAATLLNDYIFANSIQYKVELGNNYLDIK